MNEDCSPQTKQILEREPRVVRAIGIDCPGAGNKEAPLRMPNTNLAMGSLIVVRQEDTTSAILAILDDDTVQLNCPRAEIADASSRKVLCTKDRNEEESLFCPYIEGKRLRR